jgi:hypothetical protein
MTTLDAYRESVGSEARLAFEGQNATFFLLSSALASFLAVSCSNFFCPSIESVPNFSCKASVQAELR